MLRNIMQWAINGLADSIEEVQRDEALRQWQAEKRKLLNCHKVAASHLIAFLRSQPSLEEGANRDFWVNSSFVVLSERTVQWCKRNNVLQYKIFVQHQGALDGANGLTATSKESPYLEEWKKWYNRRQFLLSLKR